MDVTLTSYVESTTVETLYREWLEAAVHNSLVLLLLVERRDMENIEDSGRPGQPPQQGPAVHLHAIKPERSFLRIGASQRVFDRTTFTT